MLVPSIFSDGGPKKINNGKMKVIKDDKEITILNLSGSGHSDNNLHHSPNWSMFKHISIEEKDAKKLFNELQKYFNKQQSESKVDSQ